ncbi:MAG TPA: glutathione S-transferase family protein, partial [Rheinheimera sp.]|nr:glutathione S-transferase family protein [Rheinheimera sp.]
DIACDIHPLNNLRVLQYLTGPLQVDESEKLAWIQHWLHAGFKALEQRLAKTAGQYCFKDDVTVADLCLVPQVYNAQRFSLDMTAYPIINRVHHNCQQLAAFALAAPEQQPDAQ